MSENETKPALPMGEFMANVQDMHAGLTEMVASALRLQMLMLEDAQNLLNEMGAVLDATTRTQDETGTDVED